MNLQLNLDNNRGLAASGYILFMIAAYGLSYAFLSSYKLGDQVFYRDLYSALEGVSLFEVFVLQSFYTGSNEPVYGLLAWSGANLNIDKDVFFSLINCLFCLILLKFLLKNQAAKLYIILVFMNFYVLVLLGPAERLKVAFLLTLMVASMTGMYSRILFASAAILSHFQVIILLGASIAGSISRPTTMRSLKKKNLWAIITGSLVLAIFFWWFYSNYLAAIYAKLESYNNEKGILAIGDIFILSVISFFIYKRKAQALLSLAVTAFAAAIVGPERINMLAFIIFSLLAIEEKKTSHPIVLAIMSYFAIKGLFFSFDVFTYGTGFN